MKKFEVMSDAERVEAIAERSILMSYFVSDYIHNVSVSIDALGSEVQMDLVASILRGVAGNDGTDIPLSGADIQEFSKNVDLGEADTVTIILNLDPDNDSAGLSISPGGYVATPKGR